MGGGAAAASALNRARTHPQAAWERTPVMGDRPTATDGAWRLLRGAVVGAAATTLAMGGHCLASGEPPRWASSVAAAAVIGAVSIALSGMRWTLPRLLALLLASQVGLHAFFVGTRPPSGLGHGHGHVPEYTATLLPTSPAMLAGHLVAAVATAVLLRRGESWLLGVLDALALRAFRLLDAVVTVYGVRPRPVPIPVHALPRQRTAADAWWERGPPR